MWSLFFHNNFSGIPFCGWVYLLTHYYQFPHLKFLLFGIFSLCPGADHWILFLSNCRMAWYLVRMGCVVSIFSSTFCVPIKIQFVSRCRMMGRGRGGRGWPLATNDLLMSILSIVDMFHMYSSNVRPYTQSHIFCVSTSNICLTLLRCL